jgi:hypothetical protein
LFLVEWALPLTSPSSVEKTRKQRLMPLVLFLQNNLGFRGKSDFHD